MCSHSALPLHRHRSSPYEAVAVNFAEKTVLEECHPPEIEKINGSKLGEGQIIAEDLHSLVDLPPVRTAIMDGYAIKCKQQGRYLEHSRRRLIGVSYAGGPLEETVGEDTCARISTGAPVPPGADAVVKVECTVVTENSEEEELEIEMKEEVCPGHSIRQPGSDISKGQLLFKKGTILHPAELGVLLAAGHGPRPVAVYKKPKLVVISTGNELVDPSEEEIPNAAVRDTNRPQLIALFKGQGAEVIDGGIGVDTQEALINSIEKAFSQADVLVTSGSVSMGEKDLLKHIMRNHFNFKIHYGRIMMKPGLPCTFASGIFNEKKKLFFALPGNPVSSLVCSQLFVLPALFKMSGRSENPHERILVKLTEDVPIGDRPEFMRGILSFSKNPEDLSPTVQLFRDQRSSRLMSAVGSNVLVEMPSSHQFGKGCVAKGSIVKAIIIGNVLNAH